jgi:hypothetical protein
MLDIDRDAPRNREDSTGPIAFKLRADRAEARARDVDLPKAIAVPRQEKLGRNLRHKVSGTNRRLRGSTA